MRLILEVIKLRTFEKKKMNILALLAHLSTKLSINVVVRHAPSVVRRQLEHITKTCLFKYIDNFTTKKNENFPIKNPDIFHISAQNINCGYPLEPPR